MAERATAGRDGRAEIVDKSPDAFRTISEVAIDLDLPQHVLRFWETRFVQIKPLKRGGGRRYYRPDDVDLLKGIRHLLYGEGYTIRGVQRILKEQGVRFVMNVWREGAPQPPPDAVDAHGDDRGEPAFDDEIDEEIVDEAADQPPDDAYSPYAPHHLAPAPAPREIGGADFAVPMVRPSEPTVDTPREPPRFTAPRSGGDAEGAAALAQRFAPRFVDDEPVDLPPPPLRVEPRPAEPRPPSGGEAPVPPRAAGAPTPAVGNERMPIPRATPTFASPENRDAPRPGIGQFFDRLRAAGGREPEPAAPPRTIQALSRDEVRRLQSTLFELLECKRLLDQVR